MNENTTTDIAIIGGIKALAMFAIKNVISIPDCPSSHYNDIKRIMDIAQDTIKLLNDFEKQTIKKIIEENIPKEYPKEMCQKEQK